MKSIVCPISPDKIDENIPRIVGGLVVFILLLYVLTSWVVLPSFLVVDFYLRGFSKGKYSLLALTAQRISKLLPVKGKKINKAPKLFAARLGFVFTITIALLSLFGAPIVSNYLAAMLIVFASLESLANFCVGCIVFTFFVKPYAS
ncbi:DUF4395 domain-containing protein [Labilibacter marinus]|uniref:DUF4395 domain-containing protein n=1 Tax=Labilibacter marinus TaxID=1477105 RepID=UPI00094F9042|nr:DUF4395 domain-containing protein [Labilibacter marinus]